MAVAAAGATFVKFLPLILSAMSSMSSSKSSGGSSGGGGKGGKKGGEQAAPPGIIPELQPFLEEFLGAFQGARAGEGAFNTSEGAAGEQKAGLEGLDLAALTQQALQGLLSVGTGTEFIDRVAQDLQPALLDRPIEAGQGAIREQASLGGVDRGSVPITQGIDLISELTRNFTAAVPGIAAGLGQNAIAGNQGFLGGVDSLVNRDIQNDQFNQALIPQYISALGGLGGLQGFQPTFGPGGKESMLGMFAQLAPMLKGLGGGGNTTNGPFDNSTGGLNIGGGTVGL